MRGQIAVDVAAGYFKFYHSFWKKFVFVVLMDMQTVIFALFLD